MRLLLGLLLGLALASQPAAAHHKDKHGEKASKTEEKAGRAPATEEPAAPAGRPAATEVAVPPTRVRPARARGPKRRAAATPSPAPVEAPAPAPVVPAPAATAPSVPAATAASAQPRERRPARTRRPSPGSGVLGFNAARSRSARRAPVLATVTAAAAPAAAGAVREARRRAPLIAWRPRPLPTAAAPAADTTVTRVINVIPAPLRFTLIGLALLVGLLTLRARRLEHQRQDLTDDLGLLQSALLPELPRRIGRVSVSAAYSPADGLAAGGDFYDAFALDAHRICLLVGDVAGHGRDAIPLTADVRFTLRAYLEAGLTPRAALRATATVLEPRLGGRFVTVVVAVHDSRTGLLTYAAAGHPPPLLTGVDERLMTKCACPAIGTGLPTGRRQTTLALPPGATACFYTDGLTDTKSDGRRLGPAGLSAYLSTLGPRDDAGSLLDRLVRDTDSQPDDMAACLLRPQIGAAAERADRVEELEVEEGEEGRARRFLLACHVPEAEADAALVAARDLLPVVLTVNCTPNGGAVAVHRPDTVALTLGL